MSKPKNQNHINTSKIIIRTHKGLKFFNHQDITHLKGYGRYTKIFLKDGNIITVTKLLKSFEECLPEDSFYRIHKSYLVNINCIVELKINHKSSIILENGENIEIAKRRKAELFQKFSDWLV